MYTLMIVDDEPNIIEGIRLLLDWKELGIGQVVSAGSAIEVMSHIVEWMPDISLVDVKIGSDLGYELIGRLNALGIKSNYIMMSGYDEFDYACEAMRCGAQDYLLKPVLKTKLLASLKKIIIDKLHGTLWEKEEAADRDPILNVEYEAMSTLAHKMIMMVKVDYAGRISLKSIADKFRMNATYLGQLFIKETGMKFSEYLMCWRLYMARERIMNSNEKIEVIAAHIGYSNMSYFYQQFHNYYHITPSEMRIKG